MGGSIKKKSEEKPPTTPHEPSSLRTIEQWLLFLGEAYGHKWSKPQMAAYRLSLEDLPQEQLDHACRETLRTWETNAMPSPGFIRGCLKNRPVETAQFLGLPALTYPDVSQEERDAALEDPEYQATKQKALEAEIHLVAKEKKGAMKPPRPMNPLLYDERVEELEKQKSAILTKFPQKETA